MRPAAEPRQQVVRSDVEVELTGREFGPGYGIGQLGSTRDGYDVRSGKGKRNPCPQSGP